MTAEIAVAPSAASDPHDPDARITALPVHVRRRWPTLIIAAGQLLLDILLLAAAFLLAYRLDASLTSSGFLPPPGRVYIIMLAVLEVTALASFNVAGLYTLKRGVSRVDEFAKLCSSLSVGVVLALAVNSFLLGSRFVYTRQLLLSGWALAIVCIAFGRLVYSALIGTLRRHGVTAERAVIVGTGSPARTVLETVRRSPHLGYHVVGFIADDLDHPMDEREMLGLPILGTTDCLPNILRKERVDEVLIALAGASQARLVNLVDRCADDPVSITVYPDTFQLITNNELSIGDLGGLPMVQVRTIALRGWNRALKRTLDILVSLAALIFLSPLLMLLALFVKATSPGPVFLVQERVGRDGRPFWCIKYRTMRQDAEAQTGPVWTTPNDPRRTRLGVFMRRFSLDEFPQFINVLLGEMSVVGPRPERPVFVDQFTQSIPRYARRHREKAGITGWAQVNGLRGNTSIEERTRYDLYYVENWSLFFDVKIIAKTIILIFRDRNAY
ncbi:MAG: undecaprenyl-phosphate glucose phosphotransferase [Chloroflexota bacterium]|nr:undecaprenyl-phosphate glucose phosphotransferase [Chloroflexota bacterium]MDQ6906412.1 undecaprenyl-phosphate glucose phosphotransferase [Chloroflexota bacterium]